MGASHQASVRSVVPKPPRVVSIWIVCTAAFNQCVRYLQNHDEALWQLVRVWPNDQSTLSFQLRLLPALRGGRTRLKHTKDRSAPSRIRAERSVP
jgi:hypothetical protein